MVYFGLFFGEKLVGLRGNCGFLRDFRVLRYFDYLVGFALFCGILVIFCVFACLGCFCLLWVLVFIVLWVVGL